jgi:hypothetical protein
MFLITTFFSILAVFLFPSANVIPALLLPFPHPAVSPKPGVLWVFNMHKPPYLDLVLFLSNDGDGQCGAAGRHQVLPHALFFSFSPNLVSDCKDAPSW